MKIKKHGLSGQPFCCLKFTEPCGCDVTKGNCNGKIGRACLTNGQTMDNVAHQIKKGVCFYGALVVNGGLVFVMSVLMAGTAMADRDGLILKYEPGQREFKRYEIGDKIIYFHQRMIDDAIVEKDFINYQFHRDTKELTDKKMHWRKDLPEHVAPVITKEQAEYMAEGEVQFSRLYIISPKSDVYPLDPTPENPCWIVRSISDGNMIVTIIDAVTGKMLGYGVPPPK